MIDSKEWLSSFVIVFRTMKCNVEDLQGNQPLLLGKEKLIHLKCCKDVIYYLDY